MGHRVLMAAFHYPPCSGSSGLQRTLAFTRYLPEHGWSPALLTATPNAYEQVGSGQQSFVPPGMPIRRALALDVVRHLSLGGRYPAALAVPDRWALWKPFAIRAGLKLIEQFRPDLIWSTYPLATTHAIAAALVRRTGLPWVADMRDPMVELDAVSGVTYPTNPAVRDARLRIEADVNALAAAVVFCTRSARRIFLDRYRRSETDALAVIPNGFDEAIFAQVERTLAPRASGPRQFRLIHSGTIYPGLDRGPDALLQALAVLREHKMLPEGFRLVLRAAVHTDEIQRLAAKFSVADLVELAPSIPYDAAIAEMMTSEGLLVLQGRTSNPAIPAKVYEYLRCRRPILALVHPEGDTADLLQSIDAGLRAPLDDADAIRATLIRFFAACADGTAPTPPLAVVSKFSRAHQTADLAALLTATVATSARPAARAAR